MKLTYRLSFLVRNFNSRGVREYVMCNSHSVFFFLSFFTTPNGIVYRAHISPIVRCVFDAFVSFASHKGEQVLDFVYLSECGKLKCIRHHYVRNATLHLYSSAAQLNLISKWIFFMSSTLCTHVKLFRTKKITTKTSIYVTSWTWFK